MKKSKFLVLGIIALMLAGGLVLASCDKEESSGCCTEDTFTAYLAAIPNNSVSDEEVARLYNAFPACCKEVMEGGLYYPQGCCNEALNEAYARL